MHKTRPALVSSIFAMAFGVAALSACDGSTSVFQMKVGECYKEAALEDVEYGMTKIDCAEPHQYEIYHVHTFEIANKWPGLEQVEAVSDEVCETHFVDFVGIDYEESELYYTYLSPSQGSWSDEGDRELLCMITNEDETEISGSMRNAKR